jgi:hypothetical protein
VILAHNLTYLRKVLQHPLSPKGSSCIGSSQRAYIPMSGVTSLSSLERPEWSIFVHFLSDRRGTCQAVSFPIPLDGCAVLEVICFWTVSQGQNRSKHCCSRWCQEYVPRWLGWTQEYKNHRGDTMIYPGSGRSIPYVQQLTILIPESTQNRGVTTKYTGERERFGRGIARC